MSLTLQGWGFGAGVWAVVVCAMSSPENVKTRQQVSASRVVAYVATAMMKCAGFMCQGVVVCMRPRRRSSVSSHTSPQRLQLTDMPPYRSW